MSAANDSTTGPGTDDALVSTALARRAAVVTVGLGLAVAILLVDAGLKTLLRLLRLGFDADGAVLPWTLLPLPLGAFIGWVLGSRGRTEGSLGNWEQRIHDAIARWQHNRRHRKGVPE